MTPSARVARLGAVAPGVAMVAGVLAWLWPIGLGGRMVVGGDSTQFSLGLLAFFGRSIRVGHWPLWNDLWGYGFPGLAESQMGVYYPPHLLLFGLLPPELAAVGSLTLHHVWAACGAMWAARQFGASRAGGAIAGFAWATCGFYLIHLPHQWGATTGSWMPWAWGLAWRVLHREGSPRRDAALLAAVLAVQVLPGHFQLAFTTEVGVVVLAVLGLRSQFRRALAVLAAVGAMLPLAACQLVPTLALARLSGGDRGFGYLSGFAVSPIHLVTYLAPGLFHQSPLWRPIAWDPFHMAPEEHLASIGLVPLFLALGATLRGWRSDPATRALAVVAAVATVLCLGPYAPGFRTLILLPGFSFFRAPARWELAAALALALLAARGWDALPAWRHVGRSLGGFVLGAVGLIAVVVALFEGMILVGEGHSDNRLALSYDAALSVMPWTNPSGGPENRIQDLVDRAVRPQQDARVAAALARQGRWDLVNQWPAWKRERWTIYRDELGGTAAALAVLLGVAVVLGGRPRALAAVLIAVGLGESAWLSRHRPFDLGPIRPLVEQSPVLARLAAEPPGTLSLDPAQNLFQRVGVAPARAYRTLDLPRPDGLLSLVDHTSDPDGLRALGIGVVVQGPFERVGFPAGSGPAWVDPARAEMIRDRALAGWLYGVDLASRARADEFTLSWPLVLPTRAWLAPAGWPGAPDPSGIGLARLPQSATPLVTEVEAPERFGVARSDGGPLAGRVIIARTFDPEWQATWINSQGEERPGVVAPGPGGWMVADPPGATGWPRLRLRYDGRAARLGLVVSGAAWAVWVVVLVGRGRGRRTLGDVT